MTIKDTNYPQNIYNTLFGHKSPNDYGPITKDMTLGLSVALSELSEREEEMIRLRYEKKMSYKQIGVKYGVTQGAVRNVVERALRRLRHPYRSSFIRYGVIGGVSKVRDDAFERGQNVGYQRGYQDAIIAGKGIDPNSAEAQVERDKEIPLVELNFGVRIHNCLVRRGLYTAADAIALDSQAIRRIRNLGKKEFKKSLYAFEKWELPTQRGMNFLNKISEVTYERRCTDLRS